ncbi:GNAT family N-acetyltransferase [Pseudomonas rustica]
MIRLAIATDEPEIRQCAQQAYARYVPLIGRKPAPMTADFARQIAQAVVYVATDDQSTFQGFIVFYAEQGHMLLENVAVLPSAAGRGVGKALISFCENTASTPTR